VRWRQEQQNELWIGRRDAPNLVMSKDPAVMTGDARSYAHLPAGHQEGWADAFCNVIRDIYFRITSREQAPGGGAALATFEDGYRVACLVDAVLASHARGGAWTPVHAGAMAGEVR
jgi:hypothetical protein